MRHKWMIRVNNLLALIFVGCAHTITFKPIDKSETIALMPCPYFSPRFSEELNMSANSKKEYIKDDKSCSQIEEAVKEFTYSEMPTHKYVPSDSSRKLISDIGYGDKYFQIVLIKSEQKDYALKTFSTVNFEFELEDPNFAKLMKERYGIKYLIIPLGNVAWVSVRGTGYKNTGTITDSEFLIGLYDVGIDSAITMERISEGGRKTGMMEILNKWYGMKQGNTQSGSYSNQLYH